MGGVGGWFSPAAAVEKFIPTSVSLGACQHSIHFFAAAPVNIPGSATCLLSTLLVARRIPSYARSSAMAVVEDAATVLEDFIQDGNTHKPIPSPLLRLHANTMSVANLPAEMAHLLEEIQAKDKCVQDCRNTIASRDNSLQKFIRTNGSLAVHPKEELYAKTIGANYEQAQVLQEEKVLVSEKAAVIVSAAVSTRAM